MVLLELVGAFVPGRGGIFYDEIPNVPHLAREQYLGE